MHNNTYTFNSTITYQVRYFDDNDKLLWEILIPWSHVYAALNLDPDPDEYDGTRDDELCQMLLACGAPAWVKNATDSYNDPEGWVVWGEALTDDELVGWAMVNPDLAGPTDDLQGLREHYVVWETSRVDQALRLPGTPQ